MAEVAFVLGAGAHRPYGFPVGNELKDQVAELLENEWPDRNDPESPSRRAARAIRDCGVSIDRFLSLNSKFNEVVRPAIARCLLRKESAALNTGMVDWLGYVWPSLSREKGKLSDRFAFVTFNYDRTLEYRLARSCAALWDMPIIDACNMVDSYGIYHVYGSLGNIGSAKGRESQLEYGRDELFVEGGKRIKIIGEFDDVTKPTTKAEIRTLLANTIYIFILGCAYHPENMELLGIEHLPQVTPNRQVIGSFFELKEAEKQTVRSSNAFLHNGPDIHWAALELLRQMREFQTVR